MSQNRFLRILLALTTVACLLPVLSGAPVPADGEGKGSAPAQRVTRELDQPLSIEIVDQPLPQAIKLLREQTKLNLTLDAEVEALFKNEEQPQPKVTLQVKDVKVRQGLRSLLEPYRLHFAVIGERIVIGSPDSVIERQMGQLVSVDLDQVALASAVKKLAKETGANVLVDSRAGKLAETAITLQAEDVPLETAVHLLGEMAGLKPIRVGNILFVTTKESATALASNQDLMGANGSRGRTASAYGPSTRANATPSLPPPSLPAPIAPVGPPR